MSHSDRCARCGEPRRNHADPLLLCPAFTFAPPSPPETPAPEGGWPVENGKLLGIYEACPLCRRPASPASAPSRGSGEAPWYSSAGNCACGHAAHPPGKCAHVFGQGDVCLCGWTASTLSPVESPGAAKVDVEIIRGAEGLCVAVNGTRIAGEKPWGGGKVVESWEVDAEDVREALPAAAPREVEEIGAKAGTRLAAQIAGEAPERGDGLAPWYEADGSTVMLPAEEVERRRKLAAKVLAQARAFRADFEAHGRDGVALSNIRPLFAALDDLDARPSPRGTGTEGGK